jgi:putative transposase
MWRHRPYRLRTFVYVGVQRYSLTLCTFQRAPAFADGETVARVLLLLRQHASEAGFAVAAYCFMPDHLHILAVGTREDADLQRFVARFKQVSGFRHRQATRASLWQSGYADRVLREDEPTMVLCRYILSNPVRAGLATAIGEYPYAGSEVYRLEDIVDQLCAQG